MATIPVFNLDITQLTGVLFALSIAIIIGALDDHHHISVRVRFSGQITAALVMCTMSGIIIHELGDLFGIGSIQLNNGAILFTIFATIGIMNAINLIDGIDGLAAGVSLVCLTAITIAKILNAETPQFSIILAISTSTFLWYNLFSKNKVFLGDAGSTFLGLSITWLLIDSSQGLDKSIQPITAVWILSLPIFDTLAIMIRRLQKGQSPFRPDRNHLHHIFMRAGFTDKKTLVILLLLSSLLAFIGLLLNHLNTHAALQFLMLITLFITYYQTLNYSWRLIKLFR